MKDLVGGVPTPPKNMSSSDWIIIPTIGENKNQINGARIFGDHGPSAGTSFPEWKLGAPRGTARIFQGTRPGSTKMDFTQLWKITIFDVKIHYKWPFSIAMLNYQRVFSHIFPVKPLFRSGISNEKWTDELWWITGWWFGTCLLFSQ